MKIARPPLNVIAMRPSAGKQQHSPKTKQAKLSLAVIQLTLSLTWLMLRVRRVWKSLEKLHVEFATACFDSLNFPQRWHWFVVRSSSPFHTLQYVHPTKTWQPLRRLVVWSAERISTPGCSLAARRVDGEKTPPQLVGVMSKTIYSINRMLWHNEHLFFDMLGMQLLSLHDLFTSTPALAFKK